MLCQGGPMTTYNFIKACAFGNDFVILYASTLCHDHIRVFAHRRFGVGCDQVILVDDTRAIPYVRFFNADGSESKTCGNGTLCVASLLCAQIIETPQGLIDCHMSSNSVSVNLGKARISPLDLPLRNIPKSPVGVDIGNPHAIYFVDHIQSHDLETLGPIVEKHPIFPNRTNVELAFVENRKNIHLQIWERGTGITPACGSGATATFAAARYKGLVDDQACVHMPGGSVDVSFQNECYWLKGEGHILFEGNIQIDEKISSSVSLSIKQDRL
jgi:diaminopimelate epimerase